jgi:uncharacterized Zn finger protein (UPF0148 family)
VKCKSDIIINGFCKGGKLLIYQVEKAMGSKKLDVICPCCETKLQVDKKTGEVIWEEKKEKPMPSLSDMVNDLGSQQKENESLFKKHSESQKERSRLLDEKLKESLKHVDRSSTDKPLRDFDFD